MSGLVEAVVERLNSDMDTVAVRVAGQHKLRLFAPRRGSRAQPLAEFEAVEFTDAADIFVMHDLVQFADRVLRREPLSRALKDFDKHRGWSVTDHR